MAAPTLAPPVSPPLLVAARPRQWVKNVLVFAAPLAAGDVAADRRHPVKCRRPVASGAVSVRTAWLCGLGLMVAALAVAPLAGLGLLGCVAAYLALTFAYSWRLKRIAVVDILAVAGGF